MGKWLGAAAIAAVLVVGATGAGPAWADHSMDSGTAAACSPSGTSLSLVAEGHKFDKDCLAVTAGEAFTIRFENRDTDRHNVAILPSHTATETLFQGDIIPGPKNTVYAVPNMRAGTYHFHCEIHPNLMNGTFIVAAAPTTTTGKPAPTPTPSPTLSMGADTPAPVHGSSPKPDAAVREPAAAPAQPAPKPAPAAKAAPAPQAAPAPAAAPAAEAPAPSGAAAGAGLARTGPPASRLLLLLAGLALAAGGLATVGAARR
jgi:plastocyanin